MEGKTVNNGGWLGSRRRRTLWIGAVLILLLPLALMQFSDEVNWSVLDFALSAVLLFGAGLAYELSVRTRRHAAYQAAAGLTLVTAFVLVWLSLGVGIIGQDGDPANLMYLGVLAVGVTGSLLARFQPAGMVRALLATALGQVVVAVIALAAGWGSASAHWPLDILGLTPIFVTLWLAAAWLFRRAARGG